MTFSSINPASSSRFLTIIRWAAYISTCLLFALWSLIFVQRLPMFLSAGALQLPRYNWLIQGIHLLLLVGYLLVFRLPKAACFVISISSSVLFAYTAGENAFVYTMISMIPVFLLVVLWWNDNKLKTINKQWVSGK